MHYIYKIMFSTIILFGFSKFSFSQNQPHLLDLRTCEKNCSSSNYTIQSVYLSDVNGNPITSSLLSCSTGLEQTAYISFKYQTSSNSDVNNARLFAELIMGEETQFLNYFFGVIPSASSGSKTLTLSNFPLNWICGIEVSLNNPLLLWTTSAAKDHSQTYDCNDYPTGQCQFQSNIIVEAPLAVQYEYTYSCPSNGITPVSFSSTTNGGRAPYQYVWTFTNANLSTSNSIGPSLDYFGPGTASLHVTDANGTVSTYQTELDFPLFFDHAPVMTHQTNEEPPNGSIELALNGTSDYTYSWTGPNGFTSDERNIYGLSDGIYQVAIVDSFGCIEKFDIKIEHYITLHLWKDDLNVNLDQRNHTAELKWSFNTEIEYGHFEVERAIHDIEAFSTVGIMPISGGSNDSNTFYFTDEKLPIFPNRIYYRVKLLTFGGKAQYSSTLMVETLSNNTDINWSAFPNPFEWNNLQLNYTGDPRLLKGVTKIRIYSPSSTFYNQISTTNNPIDLSNFVQSAPKGLLVIEINNLNNFEILKVIKK